MLKLPSENSQKYFKTQFIRIGFLLELFSMRPTIKALNSTKVIDSRDKTIEVTGRNQRDEDEAGCSSAFCLSVIFLLGQGSSKKRKPTEPVGHSTTHRDFPR